MADSVLVAKCIDRRVAQDPKGNIFTFYAFETVDAIKGDTGRVFEIRLLGGSIGQTRILLPIEREFQVGSEYVLMLGSPNLDGYPTVDPGSIFVVRMAVEFGRKAVVPGPNGLPMYDHATGRVLVSSPEWAFLDDFVFSLKRALQ